MRDLIRNTSLVHFCSVMEQMEIVTKGGLLTGEFAPQYGEKMKVRMSVSPNKGSTALEMFGQLEEYDRTMTCSDPWCPIDEGCVLWLDGADLNGPHNYVVVKRAPWKNSTAYAIRKVTVR